MTPENEYSVSTLNRGHSLQKVNKRLTSAALNLQPRAPHWEDELEEREGSSEELSCNLEV